MGYVKELGGKFALSVYKNGLRKTLSKLPKHPEVRILVVFALASLAGTAAGSVLYYLFLPIMPASLAFFVSQSSASVVVFLINWADGTARSEGQHFWKSMIKFVAIQSCVMLLGSVLVYVYEHFLGVSEGWALWLTYPFTFMINYIVSRKRVFKKK